MIHSLVFLWTPKGFISPEYFLNIPVYPVYPSGESSGKITWLKWVIYYYN